MDLCESFSTCGAGAVLNTFDSPITPLPKVPLGTEKFWILRLLPGELTSWFSSYPGILVTNTCDTCGYHEGGIRNPAATSQTHPAVCQIQRLREVADACTRWCFRLGNSQGRGPKLPPVTYTTATPPESGPRVRVERLLRNPPNAWDPVQPGITPLRWNPKCGIGNPSTVLVFRSSTSFR